MSNAKHRTRRWLVWFIIPAGLTGISIALSILNRGVGVAVRKDSRTNWHWKIGLGTGWDAPLFYKVIFGNFFEFVYVRGDNHSTAGPYGNPLPIMVWLPSPRGNPLVVTIPFYVPIIVFGLLSRYTYKKWRSSLQKAAGCCPHCGYDLRSHAPGDKCPECGTPIPTRSSSAPTLAKPPTP